jgi:uncharacterized membrane protein
MRPGIKPAIAVLAVLGAGDLAAVPLMAAAHSHNPNQPPIAAIVATAIIGLVTLASAAGLARGQRWSYPAAIACRVLDSISMLLGLVAHPNAALVTIAAAILILSVAAIVLLRRLSPRKSDLSEVAQPSRTAQAAQPGKER